MLFCFNNLIKVDNVTGKITKENNLKMPIFLSRLSNAQKLSAVNELEKCTASFSWPQPFMQYKGVESYVSAALSQTWTTDEWITVMRI